MRDGLPLNEAYDGADMNRQSINTALTIAQQNGLRQLLDTLLDYDEPEAVVSSLQRIAERKAYSVTRGRIDGEAAGRWLAVAEALGKVSRELV